MSVQIFFKEKFNLDEPDIIIILVGTAEHSPSLCIFSTCGTFGFPWFDRRPTRLVERNSEGFSSSRRSALVLWFRSEIGLNRHQRQGKEGHIIIYIINLRSSTALLDIILTSVGLTPRDHNDTLIIQVRHNIFPSGDFDQPRVICVAGTSEHVALDGLKEFGDGRGDVH